MLRILVLRVPQFAVRQDLVLGFLSLLLTELAYDVVALAQVRGERTADLFHALLQRRKIALLSLVLHIIREQNARIIELLIKQVIKH